MIHIVATTPNWGIGLKGRIPWDCPQDRTWLRAVMRGRNVVVGRKTFQSLSRAAREGTGRGPAHYTVLTRNPQSIQRAGHITVRDSLREYDARAFVYGGREIYDLTARWKLNGDWALKEIWRTVVPYTGECDVYYEQPECGWEIYDVLGLSGGVKVEFWRVRNE